MSSECADKSKLLFLAQKNGVDFVFYDLFCELCKAKGVSVTKATVEIGLSRTIGTKWKRTGATPNGETLNKIADYFGVTADYLLTGEQKEKAPALTEKDERRIGDDEIKAAFWGGEKDLTPQELDELWDDVKEYAAYKAAQKRNKKGKQ